MKDHVKVLIIVHHFCLGLWFETRNISHIVCDIQWLDIRPLGLIPIGIDLHWRFQPCYIVNGIFFIVVALENE
ncbi:MAG: hypothetical protein IPJ37_07655 [Bacteroidales bacterium]|nr:hypothetical protein [Bacteroidales bacterium]